LQSDPKSGVRRLGAMAVVGSISGVAGASRGGGLAPIAAVGDRFHHDREV
jgi:hypothetical protein